MDALDKLEPSVLRALLDGLRSLSILVLNTSRNNPMIEEEFKDSFRIELGTSTVDLELYITAQLTSDPVLSRLIGEDASLRKVLVDSIIRESHGM